DLADRICVLESGTPIATGTPDEVLNDPRVVRAYLGSAGGG
ncbi:MAG: ABC transporter ATP-binding protein, partial [Burkholderiales bacterium]